MPRRSLAEVNKSITGVDESIARVDIHAAAGCVYLAGGDKSSAGVDKALEGVDKALARVDLAPTLTRSAWHTLLQARNASDSWNTPREKRERKGTLPHNMLNASAAGVRSTKDPPRSRVTELSEASVPDN